MPLEKQFIGDKLRDEASRLGVADRRDKTACFREKSVLRDRAFLGNEKPTEDVESLTRGVFSVLRFFSESIAPENLAVVTVGEVANELALLNSPPSNHPMREARFAAMNLKTCEFWVGSMISAALAQFVMSAAPAPA